jgi:hypothetical protein
MLIMAGSQGVALLNGPALNVMMGFRIYVIAQMKKVM